MTFYLDTSAAIKVYLREPGSMTLRKLLASKGVRWVTSRVTYAEALAGLAGAWRLGRIARSAYVRKVRLFEADWSSYTVIEASEDSLGEAARLSEAYALRGFELIHLCSALWGAPAIFACFDTRLRAAAAMEGLEVYPEKLPR